MEQKTITLVRFSAGFRLLQNHSTAIISKKLKHICLLTEDKRASIYSVVLDDSNKSIETLIWESSHQVQNCQFSDDGHRFWIRTEGNNFKVFQLLSNNVVDLISEAHASEISAALNKQNIDFNNDTNVVSVLYIKASMIVYLDKKWLVFFKWESQQPLSVMNTVEINTEVTFTNCRKYLYCLTAGGNISAYYLENGKPAGYVSVYSLVARGTSSQPLESFCHIAICQEGNTLAVATAGGRVSIASVGHCFKPPDHSQPRWDCGQSILSTSSMTSLTSVQTTTSTRTSGSEVTVKKKPVSYTAAWKNYLSAVKDRHNSQRQASNQPSCLRHVCELPLGGLAVKGLSITAAGLAVWTSAASHGGVYQLYDLETVRFLAEIQLPDSSQVVAVGCMGLLDLIVSTDQLWAFLANLSQDVLIYKLLHCVEADCATRLLQSDQWGDLLVPQAALVDSLRHRQVDMVRLALGLHIQAFKNGFNKSLSGEDKGNWEERTDVLKTNMNELMGVIHTAISEPGMFSDKLRAMVLENCYTLLEFLHGLLTATDSTAGAPPVNIVKNMEQTIMQYVMEFRTSVAVDEGTVALEPYEPLNYLTPETKERWDHWESMDSCGIIRDAAESSCMPLAHAFLIIRRNWTSAEAAANESLEMRAWVRQMLLSMQIEEAKNVLNMFGHDPNEELLKICVGSLDQSLRDTLAAYLEGHGLMGEAELEAWRFLQRIDSVVQTIPVSSKSFSQKIRPFAQSPQCDIPLDVHAAHLSIRTVTQQSLEWRAAVMVDLFFCTQDFTMEPLVAPSIAWKYLLRHNQHDLLVNWVDGWYSNYSDTGDKLLTLLSSWEITQDMIDDIGRVDAMKYTKEIVLDHLSRFGVFSTEEKKSVCSVLTRVCRTKSVHKLQKILTSHTANVSYRQFEELLAKLCVKHKLYNVLCTCLQESEFSEETQNSLCQLSSNTENPFPWFKLWLVFRELKTHLADVSLIYQAVLNTAAYLGGGNTEAYLREHPLVVLALIIFSKQPLQDVFQEDGPSNTPLTRSVLQSTAVQLPLLEMALLRPQGSKQTPDITVYKLLEGRTMFDISKLFTWQKTHSTKGEEMPHFLMEKYVSKYGYKDTLNYLYYLKEERPCFAVNLFIVQQLQAYKRLSKKMRKQACNFAHGLALQNFNNPGVTASCISFVEMLGNNSDSIRVHIAVANTILNHLKSLDPENSGREQLRREQVGMLLSKLVAYKDKAAAEIFPLLEIALLQSYTDRCLADTLLHWQLAAKFARMHNLRLPECFLRECAQQDKWFPFMLYAELQQYPLEQVLELVKEFHSEHLREHLSNALDIPRVDRSRRKSPNRWRLRDSRKMLYHRIGLRKGEEVTSDITPEGSPTSSSDDCLSVSQTSSLGGSDPEMPGPGGDVFLVLLNCHANQDPPRALLDACLAHRNPVLAVFATCYEPSSVLACLCSWLFTSLAEDVASKLTANLGPVLQHHCWSHSDLEKLLWEAVASNHIATVSRGFRIFLHENPLTSYFDFLVESVVKKHFKESINHAKLFKTLCQNLKSNPQAVDSADFEGAFLSNQHWVGTLAVRLVIAALANCFLSSYHELLFLRTLHEVGFTDNLPVPTVDVERFLRMAECLSGSGVRVHWNVMCETLSREAEAQRCLQLLIKKGCFQQALELAALAGLCQDSIIITQLRCEFQTRQNESDATIETENGSFWKKCEKSFTEYGVEPKLAANFFRKCSRKVNTCTEKYYVLRLALLWYKKNQSLDPATKKAVSSEVDTVELEMWKCWLQCEPEDQNSLGLVCLSPTSLLHSTSSELARMSRVTSIEVQTTLTDKGEVASLDVLIGRLLDQGDVVTACRVEHMFRHNSKDLQILLTCMALAERVLLPYQLSAEHRLLLAQPQEASKSSYRSRTLQSMRTSLSSVKSEGNLSLPATALNTSTSSEVSDAATKDKQDTLSVIECLSEHLVHGKFLGNRVFLCYRISLKLGKPYQDILRLEHPLSLLKIPLTDSGTNKFLIASDIVSAAQVRTEDVADLLCEEIAAAISQQRDATLFNAPCPMWGCDLNTSFHVVLEMCSDISLLGNRLLSRASVTDSLKEVVELVVRAHDCYSAACNMEGIAATLRAARSLTDVLLSRQEWALMVRLLAGMERYTEMSYIFHILKENDQFEYLLGKGLDKVPGLRLALLDFLSSRKDRELFHMVALHFSLHAEVAAMWEEEGKAAVEQFVKGGAASLMDTEQNRSVLQSAMLGYSHAAEFYLQADKLTRALWSARQAELIALQISLLSPAREADCLLGLEQTQVAQLITNTLSFPQACIIVAAYGHPADWGAALYQHSVVQGDATYLAHLMHNMTLTPALVEDAAKRFRLEETVTAQMVHQMKKIVSSVTNVEVQYRIASQLGFRDILETLLNGPDLAYLKDTVWRKGFSSHNAL